MSFVVPTEITFQTGERNISLVRDRQDYINITNLRNDSGDINFCNFKQAKKTYLKTVSMEEKIELVITEGKSTWVHERVLEMVLRYYKLDEYSIIDKFVHPGHRVIGKYKYNKVEIFVHLRSKYINGSKFCQLFDANISAWTRKKTTRELVKMLSNKINVSEDLVIQKGLGYDSGDVWIPQNILPMLAIWCSAEYALFVSEVMFLFHSDPMKLAAMSIKEYDNQNSTYTTALISTTDSKSEYDIEIGRMKKYISQLKNRNSMLEFDNMEIREQTKLFVELRDDHGVEHITSTLATKREWLTEYVEPLQRRIAELNSTIEAMNQKIASMSTSPFEEADDKSNKNIRVYIRGEYIGLTLSSTSFPDMWYCGYITVKKKYDPDAELAKFSNVLLASGMCREERPRLYNLINGHTFADIENKLIEVMLDIIEERCTREGFGITNDDRIVYY
jgi:hypothetical protein